MEESSGEARPPPDAETRTSNDPDWCDRAYARGDPPSGMSVLDRNRLDEEASPYLRQHADNPVN
ncbi:MAG: hypothetical protein V5A61_07320, partial [Haloarculaceae archaeon]